MTEQSKTVNHAGIVSRLVKMAEESDDLVPSDIGRKAAHAIATLTTERNSNIKYANLNKIDDSTFSIQLTLTYKNTDFSEVLMKLQELSEFIEGSIDTLNKK